HQRRYGGLKVEALEGRQLVVDTIAQPVGLVDVQIVNPAGTVLDSTSTDASGTFTFSSGVSCPTVFDLVIDPAGLNVRRRFTNPIGQLNFIVVRRPLMLTASV